MIFGRATVRTAVNTADRLPLHAVADNNALRDAGAISACTRHLQRQTVADTQQGCHYRIWV